MAINGSASGANTDQAAYWNSAAGQKWALFQDQLDASLAPVTEVLLRASVPRPGEAVLDVGCGTGATAEAFAAAVGPAGRVAGVDISQSQIAAAKARPPTSGAGATDYLLADAQTHAFEPESFDLVTSRFGMMFFADPVAAFANLHAALRPGGRLVFATWAALAANPWFSAARDAAVARLGAMPPEPPGAPGPFALADPARGLAIMAEAGFTRGETRQARFGVLVRGDAGEAATLAANFGPASRAMREHAGTPEDFAAIVRGITAAFAGFADGDVVRVPGVVNVFSGMRSAP